MHVLVAGASGAIGRPLVRGLIAAGHEVTATTRSAVRGQALEAMGATAVITDVLDRDALLDSLRGVRADAVISQLTDLKKPPMRERDMASTDRLRTEGTRNLLAAAHQIGAKRFVTQSMMFGYGFAGADRPHTERDAFPPSTGARFDGPVGALGENEAAVFGDPEVEGIALRYGLFYGVGAGDDDVVKALRKRWLPVVRGGRPLSWVYLDDAATAAIAALERGIGGQAYNIADDEPVSWADMFSALAAAVGAPRPRAVPRWLVNAVVPYLGTVMSGGVTIATDKAKRELSWSPRVASYREGVQLIASAHTGPTASHPIPHGGRVAT